METKEKTGQTLTEEAKARPEWKDMTSKEKCEKVVFWVFLLMFFDIILSAHQREIPGFIELPVGLVVLIIELCKLFGRFIRLVHETLIHYLA